MISEELRLKILERHAKEAQAEIQKEEAALQRRAAEMRARKQSPHIETPEEVAARYADEPQIMCISLVGTAHSGGDGTHYPAIWNALGYSGAMHLNEIFEIPESFFEQLKREGAVSTDPRLLEEWQDHQGNYQRLQREWREKQKENRAKAERDYREAEILKRVQLKEAEEASKQKQKLVNQVLKEM